MKTITSFKSHYNGKSSQVIRDMIKGLLMTDEERGFKIDMATFGIVRGTTCYGCAATCAVRVSLDVDPPNGYAEFLADRENSPDYLPFDFVEFERAVDDLRQCDLSRLEVFLGVEIPTRIPNPPMHMMLTNGMSKGEMEVAYAGWLGYAALLESYGF